ncbi:MAG: kinase/pyrophosphorylase [Thermomicrobiales bacterium]
MCSGRSPPCSVSDGGGATADAAVNAATVQFPSASDSESSRRPGIRTREQVLRVVREASSSEAIVVHTIVVQDSGNLLVRECRLRLIPHVDLIGPLIGYITQEVGRRPIFQPGVALRAERRVLERIDAIQFTVQHDDGQAINDLDQADCVLVGVSRTSKTPLSIYLSRCAAGESPCPDHSRRRTAGDARFDRATKDRALTIDAAHLERIRKARLGVAGAADRR